MRLLLSGTNICQQNQCGGVTVTAERSLIKPLPHFLFPVLWLATQEVRRLFAAFFSSRLSWHWVLKLVNFTSALRLTHISVHLWQRLDDTASPASEKQQTFQHVRSSSDGNGIAISLGFRDIGARTASGEKGLSWNGVCDWKQFDRVWTRCFFGTGYCKRREEFI